ncbi:UNVERIFIED_CONTAM: hypothetical protein GTU68_046019 [Idotea baltica]|nr:hypothetical protein [Idotea baltica]
MDTLTTDLLEKAKSDGISLAEDTVDDVLTYALFPQVGLKFLKNRRNPEAFEPAPTAETAAPVAAAPQPAAGELTSVSPSAKPAQAAQAAPAASSDAEAVPAPLAGNIFKVIVQPGAEVAEGDVLLILEAMKMETEVRAARGGIVQELNVKEGDAVTVGAPLLSLA